MKKVPVQTPIEYPDVDALRSSIIHDLSPLSEQTSLIDIAKIEIDETNVDRSTPHIRDDFGNFTFSGIRGKRLVQCAAAILRIRQSGCQQQ